jgi:CheY-like chemotaxis protein
LCSDCRKEVPAAELDAKMVAQLKSRGQKGTYYKAGGCDNCQSTGFKGRIALLEFLQITRELKEKISNGTGDEDIRKIAIGQKALQTMLDDALWHLGNGDTTLEEIVPYITFDETVGPTTNTVADKIKAPAKKKDKKILVVDDDPTIREMLRLILEKDGADVIEAEDGSMAIEMAHSQSPDLMVLDLNMPKKDGRAVIHHLRDEENMTSMPIIVLTTESDEKNQTETLNAGADDYILKPLKSTLVVARVNAAIRRAQEY